MDHYKDQILACDFFTVETIWLQTIYVLFFIELDSCQVHIAGISSNPNEIWITQQARQLIWELQENGGSSRLLIHDNDQKFSKAFDAIFESEGIHFINTPFQVPNANAFAERWVRTVREECLDHILIIDSNHLKRVLVEYSEYYNTCRSQQGVNQHTPIPYTTSPIGPIHRRKILGGIINDYYRSPTLTTLPPS
jgi:transposase InsO family protein